MGIEMSYAPFDAVAEGYDADFTETELGRRQRQIVHARLRSLLRPGMRALELNCGTGEDALFLAGHGLDVVATDLSTTMLDVAERKAARSPFGPRISFRPLPIESLRSATTRRDLGSFDLLLSDFDGLNCLDDISWLPEALDELLSPGGYAMLVFMSPFCLMESLYYLARLQPRRAFQRLRREGLPVHIGESIHLRTYFHPVGKTVQELATRFTIERVEAVGLTTPPTIMRDFYHRHRTLFSRFEPLENRLAARAPFNRMGDHVMVVVKKG